MLKGIPSVISPELLKVLMEMGHGDELCIGDGNFPGAAIAQSTVSGQLLRADGHTATEMLEAILKLFPLDTYAQPLYIMRKVDGDTVETPIWDEFAGIVKPYTDKPLEQIDRFDFYDRAKKSYAVLMTGETALYANIIIKKGVVKE